MKSPAFQFYANDFLGGRVATYSLEEVGLYSVLLAFDWSLVGLPTEPEKLAKLARCSTRKFAALWLTVSENFVERDGRYYNPRLELERKKQAENRKKKSDAAHSRWNADAHADAEQAQCPPSPTPSPSASQEQQPLLPQPANEEQRLAERAPLLYPVAVRFLDGKDEVARMAWCGRFHGALDRPPHPTDRELADALEDLMTRPREEWTPSLFRRYAERIRRDEQRAAERSSAPTAAASRADGADAAWDDVLAMLPAWQRREVTAEVHAKLPAGVRRGLSRIGGFNAIQNTPQDKRTWLKRDFCEGYRSAANQQTTSAA